MGKSVAVLLGVSIFCVSLAAFGQKTEAVDDHNSYSYDILGLKLGMTAEEAGVAIRDHLKLTPGLLPEGYRVDSTPRKYQDGGTFVDEFVISKPQMEVVGNFVEVFPGMGSGAESLYRISYTPRPMTSEDKRDFVNRVLAKFGRPTVVRRDASYLWLAPPYHSEKEALAAGGPVLDLDTETLKLTLSNVGIRQKMEDAFNETRKLPL